MVEQALNPFATDLAVRAIGQDGRVLQGDVHLIVKAVGNPALDLLAGGPAFVHRHVVGAGDMGVSVIAVLQRTAVEMRRYYRPLREQARSHSRSPSPCGRFYGWCRWSVPAN